MDKGNGFVMKDNKGSSNSGGGMPAVDFSTFILSLYSSALVQLGEIADPSTGAKMKDFNMAKQTVDMVIMLEEKTRGNLDMDEKNLMASLLHELRMAYAKAKGL